MAIFVDKLNQVFNMLKSMDGRTTQKGKDPSYLDTSLADIMTIDNTRVKKYSDYTWMDDNYGQELTSTLDAVADMAIRIDEPLDTGLKVMSDSESNVKFISDLYYYLDIWNRLWTWSRNLSKFGDMFVEIIWYTDGTNSKLSSIAGLKVLPAKTIFLNVEDGVVNKLFPYRQEIDGTVVAQFRPWQLVHFMLPREPTDDYGTSWLKSARLPFRQLVAMENSLVIGRLKKPNMRVHKIDVTGKYGDQQEEAILTYKKQFLKKLWMNPSTGKYEKHKVPVMNNDEIFMGVTKDGGKFAGIDIIEGKSEVDITDILYIREKMLAALKNPKHRMNINDVGASNKLVSVDQGLNFSASIQRVQLAIIMGLSFITDLALMVKGVDVNSRGNAYTIALPKQRTTDELIAARVELIRSTVAKNYKELGIISNEEIMRSVLNWSPEQIKRVQKEIEKLGIDNGDDKGDGDDKNKDKKFNKTGTGSAPVRKPQKEILAKVLKNEDLKLLISDINELMRNKRVFGNKSFNDMGFIKSEISKMK